MDILHLLPSDETLTLRAFTDTSVLEVFWMDGRVVITSPLKGHDQGGAAVFSSVHGVQLVEATAWAMGSIWVKPADVLATPRP